MLLLLKWPKNTEIIIYFCQTRSKYYVTHRHHSEIQNALVSKQSVLLS